MKVASQEDLDKWLDWFCTKYGATVEEGKPESRDQYDTPYTTLQFCGVHEECRALQHCQDIDVDYNMIDRFEQELIKWLDGRRRIIMRTKLVYREKRIDEFESGRKIWHETQTGVRWRISAY